MTSIKGEQSAERFVLLCETCGKEVHTALEEYVRDNKPLAKNYQRFKGMVDSLVNIKGDKYVENPGGTCRSSARQVSTGLSAGRKPTRWQGR